MKSLESKRIGKITTEQTIKKNQVNKVYFIEIPVRFIFLNLSPEFPYKSFMCWGLFYETTRIDDEADSHTELGLPVLA